MNRRDEVRDVIRARVTSGVHLGQLRPGERLGSARELARELGTDYRVVVAAVRGLEREGLLEVRPRAGMFVGNPAAEPPAGLGGRLVSWLVDDLGSGQPAAGFADRVRRCLETVRLNVACVECNGDQLDFLCAELHEQYGLETHGYELERVALDLPLLRRADLLVSTSQHAGEVRRLAARIGRPYILVALDPAQHEEVVRLLAERPVCVIGTDPRWAAKGRRIWGADPAAANLSFLTLGVDAVDTIPPEAALMLMPAARRQLAGSPLLARALPRRGLSRDSAQEILSFVVARNLAVAASLAQRTG